jgi:hypothetical protein
LGIVKPDPRKGEFNKNSAKDCLGCRSLSNSFVAITVTACLPFLVISWGPELSACSTTSLNFALASATAQLAIAHLHGDHSSNSDHNSHLPLAKALPHTIIRE